MFRLAPDQMKQFAAAVRSTAGRGDLAGPVSAIYQVVADAVELNRPRCDVSGRCCRFDEFGHALFVTTIEMSHFVRCLPPGQRVGREPCAFQIDGRCDTHAIRPLGCRIFYCDPEAEAWQPTLYDRLHRVVRTLHERSGVPYFYVEWRQAVEALQLAGPPMPTGATCVIGTGLL